MEEVERFLSSRQTKIIGWGSRDVWQEVEPLIALGPIRWTGWQMYKLRVRGRIGQ